MVRIPDDAIGDRDMARAYMAAIDVFRHEYPQISLAAKPWRWLTNAAMASLFSSPALMDRMDIDPRDVGQVLNRARKQTADPRAAVFVEVQPRLEGSPGRLWPSVYVPLSSLQAGFRALRESPALAAFAGGAATSAPQDAAAERRREAFVEALADDDVAFARDVTKAYIGPDPSLAEQAKEAAREVGEALGAAAGAAVDAASTGIGATVGAFWRGIPTPVKLGLGAVAVLIVFNQVRALSPRR
jgi:hypothetical protein